LGEKWAAVQHALWCETPERLRSALSAAKAEIRIRCRRAFERVAGLQAQRQRPGGTGRAPVVAAGCVVPAALLGRLAVAASAQGKGLGAALLADALLRVARVEMGVYAMLVDAKDDAARRFYEKYGFTLLAGEARRLALPIATALRALENKAAK